jgi:hypothetical protein
VLLSPHPSLPPHRGEGAFTDPCQPKGGGSQGGGCAAEEVYFIGEKAAGTRILFCWLTKNSRVWGGQLGNFWDSARTFARAARSW